jgi:hypothetical protein
MIFHGPIAYYRSADAIGICWLTQLLGGIAHHQSLHSILLVYYIVKLPLCYIHRGVSTVQGGSVPKVLNGNKITSLTQA